MKKIFARKMRNREQETIYPVRGKDRLKELLVCLYFAMVLYLFFKSVYAFILLPAAILLYHRYYRKELTEKYRAELNSQFKDALLSVSAALRAGYSMENALLESAAEMTQMYGEGSLICKELQKMKRQLSVGMPLDLVFCEFAKRSGSEDIATFSAVFAIAQKTGGDLIEIIRKTADDIAAKVDTQNEIEVLVRAKKLEQSIMTLMPPLIILYVDLSSGSLLDPMYRTLLGRVVMLACLLVYAGACLLSRKIMKIEV